VATGAEDELLRGSAARAADAFALAARSALNGNAMAAAIRYVFAARAAQRSPPASVREAIGVIVSRLGPVLELSTVGEASSTLRPAALDPEALDQLAARYAAKDDEDSATSARALAEVIRGNADSAVRIAQEAQVGGSSRSHLIAAIAQGATGRLGESVRSALLALAAARRTTDAAGEAAALALLGTLYRSLGRDTDSTALTERAHAIPKAATRPPA
jgi:hypothetical protein